MSSSSFGLNISAWCARAKDNADLVVRKVALEMFTQVIMMSPVDTGRFRGNWNVSIGRPDLQVTSVNDKTGAVSVARANDVTGQAKFGDVIYLTNNLPYARRLEYGWSQQAPEGMVRVVAERFQAVVDGAQQS